MHRGGREIRLGGVTGHRKGGREGDFYFFFLFSFPFFDCVSLGLWIALLEEVGGAGRGSHSAAQIESGMLLYCTCFLFSICLLPVS